MSAGPLNVVTGATGLLGSHIAEQLRARGSLVRALVRPTSDVAFLQSLGVELVEADLRDAAAVRRALAGADVVYHCAALVSDWGPWQLYREGVLDTTANVVAACRAGPVRLLHVSSLGVYGHPRQRADDFTEDEPLASRFWWWDYYRRAKWEAEHLARALGDRTTIVRPSWIYGPRDRNSLPRVLRAVQSGRVRLLGSGDNPLNVVHAADVAAGAILAAEHPDAGGQAYHLSSTSPITQRALVHLLCDELGVARVARHVPFRLAFWSSFVLEATYRLLRRPQPPFLTRYAVSLVGRSARFSVQKARTQLGWQPRIPPQEGLRAAVAWLRQQEPRVFGGS